MDYTETTLTSQTLYEGRIITVKKDTVALTDGTETIREVVDHPGGVGIVPVDADGFVYCVRQFRYPYGEHLLEIPAGKLERGEEPLTCAVRELGEETGFTADKYVYLGCIYPSPGYCREKLHVYLATGLTRGQRHLDAGEFLDVERYTLDELTDMVMENKLTDAKTVIGILKARRYLAERT